VKAVEELARDRPDATGLWAWSQTSESKHSNLDLGS
jgi:hypothetical protein